MPNVDINDPLTWVIFAVALVLLAASVIVIAHAVQQRRDEHDESQQKVLEARRAAENRKALDKLIADTQRSREAARHAYHLD